MHSDYIYDNCDGGRTEYYGLFCNLLIMGSYYADLNSTCTELGGRLTWFDSSLEKNELMSVAGTQYTDHNLNDFYYSGEKCLQMVAAIYTRYKVPCATHTIAKSMMLLLRPFYY